MSRLEEAVLALAAVVSWGALWPRTGAPWWGPAGGQRWNPSAPRSARGPNSSAGTGSPGWASPRTVGAQRTGAPWYRADRAGQRRARPAAADAARWATRRDLCPLLVARPAPGRLTLGRAQRRLVAAERGQSVLVVGPTQSGKTSALAVPAILEWDGPVVAASVKTDLVRHTTAWRARGGAVHVYDPTASTDLPGASWSPLAASVTWEGARRTARVLAEVARSSAGTLTDGDFWYATAAKLLAPLLFAAAASGRDMADVVRWIDTQEVDEVFDALAATGEPSAMQAARASWSRDDRQRSAVYTTAETVVEAFADPVVQARSVVGGAHPAVPGVFGWGDPVGAPGARVDASSLLDNGGTLYLCAPAHDQRRLRPLFATVVTQVIEEAYTRVARHGRPLEPPLLVVLDEAANVAPLAELDMLASTAAGHGVQLVTVWQDLAQIHSRYGARAGSVVNNHRVKVFLSGIADPGTLEHASTLIGDAETRAFSRTMDGFGAASHTDAPVMRRLVPADALRRLPPGRGVVVSGHLPPARVRLRPWQDDDALRARAQPQPNDEEKPRWWWQRAVGTLRP